MPHAASQTDRWWTGVGVCNPNGFSVTAFVLPYGQNGQVLMPVGADVFLASGAYEIFTVKQMFPDIARDIAFLKIFPESLETGNIGGFYLYGNATSKDFEARTQVCGGNM